MGIVRWELERSAEQAVMRIGKGEKEDDEEDHVAGLVEQIAHAMLDEEEDDGRNKPESMWMPHSAAQVPAGVWDKISSSNTIELPKSHHSRVCSEGMELLYMELVRLKMEELTAAQHQLSLYQKALVDARRAFHPDIASTDGLSKMVQNSMFGEQQQHLIDMPYGLAFQGQAVRGGEWVPTYVSQSQSSKPQPRLPVVYPNGRYTTRADTPLGAPTSGGTGVFLPRCRTGARHLRMLESKRKPELHFPVSTRYSKTTPLNKKKEDLVRPALQYPSYSPVQEVAPDVCLPTEWTY